MMGDWGQELLMMPLDDCGTSSNDGGLLKKQKRLSVFSFGDDYDKNEMLETLDLLNDHDHMQQPPVHVDQPFYASCNDFGGVHLSLDMLDCVHPMQQPVSASSSSTMPCISTSSQPHCGSIMPNNFQQHQQYPYGSYNNHHQHAMCDVGAQKFQARTLEISGTPRGQQHGSHMGSVMLHQEPPSMSPTHKNSIKLESIKGIPNNPKKLMLQQFRKVKLERQECQQQEEKKKQPKRSMKRRSAAAAASATLTKLEATEASLAPLITSPTGISVNPRDFRQLLSVLGGMLNSGPGFTQVELADNQAPFMPPISERLGFVEHEKSYIMSGSIGVKDRRRHDIFSDREINCEERAFWCDQGNAHAVLDTSKPLRDMASSNQPINPRTIQVAHALANRVAQLLPSEKPVIKCFYYSLHRRPIQKRKRVSDKKEKVAPAPNMSLGLHKHIYCLCDQTVAGRHQPLNGSQIWLVRYFVKGELHPTIRPFVHINPNDATNATPAKTLRHSRSSSQMSL